MIKSRFRAAMASSKLPWANITAKLNTESGDSEDGANFQVREVISSSVITAVKSRLGCYYGVYWFSMM